MEQKININGRDFSIRELNELIEKSKETVNPLDEVFKYHGTTQEEFDKLYKNIPLNVKGHALECMMVAFYNKGLKPDFNDGKAKYYPYFDMRNETSFGGNNWNSSGSFVSAAQLYLGPKAKDNMLDAVEKFIDVYKMSRNF